MGGSKTVVRAEARHVPSTWGFSPRLCAKRPGDEGMGKQAPRRAVGSQIYLPACGSNLRQHRESHTHLGGGT